jgi:hypothetical protein
MFYLSFILSNPAPEMMMHLTLTTGAKQLVVQDAAVTM